MPKNYPVNRGVATVGEYVYGTGKFIEYFISPSAKANWNLVIANLYYDGEDVYHFMPIGPQITKGQLSGAQIRKSLGGSPQGEQGRNRQSSVSVPRLWRRNLVPPFYFIPLSD